MVHSHKRIGHIPAVVVINGVDAFIRMKIMDGDAARRLVYGNHLHRRRGALGREFGEIIADQVLTPTMGRDGDGAGQGGRGP
jgi:hypothetical protein